MNKDVLVGFFVGLGMGAGAAIMLAPASGQQTRRRIKDKTDEGTQYLHQRGAELKERASEMVETGKQTVTRVKQQFTDAVSAGRQAYADASTSPTP